MIVAIAVSNGQVETVEYRKVDPAWFMAAAVQLAA